jgi:ABC-type bacteriocin/lantibiotic exporter with double-glycine peptidase domain
LYTSVFPSPFVLITYTHSCLPFFLITCLFVHLFLSLCFFVSLSLCLFSLTSHFLTIKLTVFIQPRIHSTTQKESKYKKMM